MFALLASVASAESDVGSLKTVTSLRIPAAVKGLKVTLNDPLIRSVTLSWQPNLKSEGVDKYAIYLAEAFYPQFTRELVTVTPETKISLKTWSKPTGQGKQPAGTVYLVPIASLHLYVIAHNQFGWGLAKRYAIYPDKSSGPSVPKVLINKFYPIDGLAEWQCSQALANFYSFEC